MTQYVLMYSSYFFLKEELARSWGGGGGVLIDTAAARSSSTENVQYQTCCKITGQRQKLDASRVVICHFGPGSAMSFGMALVRFSIGKMYFRLMYMSMKQTNITYFL